MIAPFAGGNPDRIATASDGRASPPLVQLPLELRRVLIVLPALVGAAQHLVSPQDFLELQAGGLTFLVQIGMMLACQPKIRLADLGKRGVSINV